MSRNHQSTRQFIALGTASSIPTKKRNHNGYYLKWDGEGLLFDPGEGTQRQMVYAGISANKIKKIFLTHFHGDHCLGLPGIIQRLSVDQVKHPIDVYFPASGIDHFQSLLSSSIYEKNVEIRPHPIVEEGVIFADDSMTITTRMLDHVVESWGYRITGADKVSFIPDKLRDLGISGAQIGRLRKNGAVMIGRQSIKLEQVSIRSKGQVFAFVMDTRLCENAQRLARDADMLVSESTFLNIHEALANKYGHMTAAQAAINARNAHAKRLVLTHFSQRYGNSGDFVGEASTYFPNIVAVKDGDCIDLS